MVVFLGKGPTLVSEVHPQQEHVRNSQTNRVLPLVVVLCTVGLFLLPLLWGFNVNPSLSEHVNRVRRQWTLYSLDVLRDAAETDAGDVAVSADEDKLFQPVSSLEQTPIVRLQSFSPPLQHRLEDLNESINRFAATANESSVSDMAAALIAVEKGFISLERSVAELDQQRQAAYRSVLIFGIILIGVLSIIVVNQNLRLRALSVEQRYQKRLIELTHNIQENERRSIARDLHDGTAQEISVARMTVDQLTESPLKGALQTTLTRVLNEVRWLYQTTSPQISEHGLIVDTIQDLAVLFRERYDTRIVIDADKNFNARLSRDEHIHFYRVVHEAMINAIRHANADTITIGLESREHQFVLRIADNGTGLGNSPEGFGRRSMRERCEILDGTIQWDTEAGRGTAVIVTLPISRR